MKKAGPRGFEPPFFGSEGRCLNPGWATGPIREIVEEQLKAFRKSLKTIIDL